MANAFPSEIKDIFWTHPTLPDPMAFLTPTLPPLHLPPFQQQLPMQYNLLESETQCV